MIVNLYNTIMIVYHAISAKLVQRFADVEVTLGFLMQLDKLVQVRTCTLSISNMHILIHWIYEICITFSHALQLLESPIFIHLRIQLLDPDDEKLPDLLKSLYGLLMLLPQVTSSSRHHHHIYD